MNLALGLIETKGLVGAIEAADAMAKAAEVKIVSKEKVTGALMVIKIIGEVAAVKSAVDAGSVAAQRVGQLISAHVIPRPDNQIDILITNNKDKKDINRQKDKSVRTKTILQNTAGKKISEKEKQKKKTEEYKYVEKNAKVQSKTDVVKSSKSGGKLSGKIPPFDQLETLNVHALRKLARSFIEFPIKGREISKANRAKLLDYFKKMR